MRFQPLQHTHLLAAVVFIAAILVLAVQLITPSPVMVSLGENGAQTTSVGEYFTYREAALLVVGAFVSGVSGTYLVFHDQAHVLSSTEQSATQANARPPTVPNGGTIQAPRAEGPADSSPPDTERWEATLERLTHNQETIYELLIEADGTLPQRQLVEETDLSKATVSRTLDKLEHRGLIERKRSGMGNTVHLQ
ncbi:MULTISPECIES: helix-turn-helix transcriptional regulator [Salinibaculum]|uniref:helix-turn-helix transcriptional regulator n=1 Tax=Salinibaculum TaxID=2732368 RepID=UPI0030D0EE0A